MTASELQKLTAGGLVSQALASGEVNSIREALRKKNLAVPVDRALRHMQICLRNVRGSEAERDLIMYKFAAIRVWSGCSSLFFTLELKSCSAFCATVARNYMESIFLSKSIL